jgi:hypothetical protein
MTDNVIFASDGVEINSKQTIQTPSLSAIKMALVPAPTKYIRFQYLNHVWLTFVP